MEARFIGIGRWRVLVARPRHHAFGILVTDVLIALHVAKQARARLLLLPEKTGIDSPLLHFQCMGVTQLDSHSMLARVITVFWVMWLLLWRITYAIREWRRHLSNAILFLMQSRAGVRLYLGCLAIGSVLSIRFVWNKPIRFIQRRYERLINAGIPFVWNKPIRSIQRRYEKSVHRIGKSVLRYYRRGSKSVQTEERIKLRIAQWDHRLDSLNFLLISKQRILKWAAYLNFLNSLLISKQQIFKWAAYLNCLDPLLWTAVLLGTNEPKPTLRDRTHESWRRFEVWLGAKQKRVILGKAIHHGYDIRELSTQSPLIVHLSEKDERAACQMLKTMALSPGDPFVVLHVRGAGSQSALQENDRSRDLSRNALLESFMPAIDEIIARGYRVVRIGDPSMAPLDRPGVIDLATGKVHDVLAQLWAVANCQFFIASDAGPYLLSWLVYPLRRTDRYLIKRVVNMPSGQPVSLSEMLTEDFIYAMKRRLYKEHTLAYLDNTPDDILSGVREMFMALDNPDVSATPAQHEVMQLVKQARSGGLSRDKTYAKTASKEVFLGAGQMVDVFAQQHLSSPAGTHSV